MKYKGELMPLLDWIRKNPGLSIGGLEDSIASLPYPENYSDDRHGTRLDKNVPIRGMMKWRVRYLELLGLVRCDRARKWYVVENDDGTPFC